MREEESNDVAIFRFSCYLYVGARLVVCQMSVSQFQYFLIFSPSSVVIFSIHTLTLQQLPQSVRPCKFFSLNSYTVIGNHKHCRIAYLERVTEFSDTVFTVEIAEVIHIWQLIRTSYGAKFSLPNACASSSKKHHYHHRRHHLFLRNWTSITRLVYHWSRWYDYKFRRRRHRRHFRLRPDTETSRRRQKFLHDNLGTRGWGLG